MDIEPFDYLTYKKNKLKNKNNTIFFEKEKIVGILICAFTFVVFFLFVVFFINSKTSKIDIEYEKHTALPPNSFEYKEIEKNIPDKERQPIDKRLFIIQQEEKYPSESKIIEKIPEQTEVISQDSFNKILNNSEEITRNSKKNYMIDFSDEIEDIETKSIESEPENKENALSKKNKIAIKPKLLINQDKNSNVISSGQKKEFANPIGALDIQNTASKVLIGRFLTLDEARNMQNSMPKIQGVSSFIKKINGQYSIQIGAYESFDVAKNIASKLKAQGYDVWIYQ